MKIKYSLKRKGNIIHFKILEVSSKIKKAMDYYRKCVDSSSTNEGIILFNNIVYNCFFGYIEYHSIGGFKNTIHLHHLSDSKKTMKLLPNKIKQVLIELEEDLSI